MARTDDGRLPIDVAANEAIRVLIHDEPSELSSRSQMPSEQANDVVSREREREREVASHQHQHQKH